MSDKLKKRLIESLQYQTKCCNGMCYRSVEAKSLIEELQEPKCEVCGYDAHLGVCTGTN